MTMFRGSSFALYAILLLSNAGCAGGGEHVLASPGTKEAVASRGETVSPSFQKILSALNRGEVSFVEIVKRDYMSTTPVSIKRELVDSVAAQRCRIKLNSYDAHRFSTLLDSVELRPDVLDTDTYWRISFFDNKNNTVSSIFVGRKYPKFSNVMVETDEGVYNDEGKIEGWLSENVMLSDCSFKR